MRDVQISRIMYGLTRPFVRPFVRLSIEQVSK